MGTVVLQGGGPFVANDGLDARLLGPLGGPIAILPTADAFENPDVLKASAQAWAERLHLSVVICDVFTRADAREDHHAQVVRTSSAVILAGDSSIHLRSTLLNTVVWDAVTEQAESGVVVGIGNCAAALCDPMIDQRGGAFGLGLGLIRGYLSLPKANKPREINCKEPLNSLGFHSWRCRQARRSLLKTEDGRASVTLLSTESL